MSFHATDPRVITRVISVHAIHLPLFLSCSQLVMVTEPVFASVANVLSGFDGIPSIQSVRLSELEVKHGITQVHHVAPHTGSMHSSITSPQRWPCTKTWSHLIAEPWWPHLPASREPIVDLLHVMACPPAVMKHLCHTIANKLHRCHAWSVCLQIAEGLQFLHADANLVHRNVCPETVVLTESGSWKLSGLGFAMMAHFGSGAASVAFDYASGSMSQTGLAGKVRLRLMGLPPCTCNICLQTSHQV